MEKIIRQLIFRAPCPFHASIAVVPAAVAATPSCPVSPVALLIGYLCMYIIILWLTLSHLPGTRDSRL